MMKADTSVTMKHTPREEFFHTLTHGGAALLGIIGLILLIRKTLNMDAIDTVGAIAYGASLILLYSASALYHGVKTTSPYKDFFQKIDHCAIFFLIVGTYIPACLTSLRGWIGYTVLAIVGICGVIGVTVNCIDITKFFKLSMALYVISGWTIAIASIPYVKAIGWQGFMFLLLGGIFYTAGIIFYRMKTVKYMHIIWHLFVVLGSVMHFIMVYFYVY